MPTLMEATWDKWFEEHDAEVHAQGREQGLTQGREQGLTQGREQGLTQGREQGLTQGREQGLTQGREQGLAEGAMRTLRRMAVARFGARTADRLSALLRSVDADRLDEVGDWMLACETDEELLDRVRTLGRDGAQQTP